MKANCKYKIIFNFKQSIIIKSVGIGTFQDIDSLV